MTAAHSDIMCRSCTKMLRILSTLMLHAPWDLLRKSRGKNLVMRVIWVFLLSRVCNYFFFLSLVTQKGRSLALEMGAEDIKGWSSP